MTSEARYDFDVSLANASENDHSAFCSVSPAVAQCTCSIRNSIFLTSLLVLLFGESECTKNNTMAAALVILLRNVERPKAGLLASWRTFLLCKHRLACQVSQTRHGKNYVHLQNLRSHFWYPRPGQKRWASPICRYVDM